MHIFEIGVTAIQAAHNLAVNALNRATGIGHVAKQ